MRFAPRFFLSITCLALAACGAKTGLLIPDIAPDHIDATDITDTPCVPEVIPLIRNTADVMFLIDRSNSMQANIAGEQLPPSRWSVLHDALAATFPAVQATLSFGAVFFPQPVNGMSSTQEQCNPSASVDVLPTRNTGAAQILRILETTQPGGGTPTYAAFQLVGQWFASQPPSRDPRYIVLATDGGPNCNFALDYTMCQCTSRDRTTMLPDCDTDPGRVVNCLDDSRTVAEIQRIADTGIPTFVIGIDDPNRPDLTMVLNRMAVAGGRPNMNGGPTIQYYSVRQQADLANAFQTIEQTIAQCTFVTTRPPASFDTIHVELNSVEVPRDPSHTNGWDVTDRAAGEITLFGPVCDGIAHDPMPNIRVRLGCDDAG